MTEVSDYVVPAPRAASPMSGEPAAEGVAGLHAFLNGEQEHDAIPASPRPTSQKEPEGPKVTQLTGAAGWAAFTVALICFHLARPEAETMFERFRGRAVRGQWDHDLVPIILGALVVQLLVVSGGVVWNGARTGRMSISLVVQLVIALGALIAVLVLL